MVRTRQRVQVPLVGNVSKGPGGGAPPCQSVMGRLSSSRIFRAPPIATASLGYASMNSLLNPAARSGGTRGTSRHATELSPSRHRRFLRLVIIGRSQPPPVSTSVMPEPTALPQLSGIPSRSVWIRSAIRSENFLTPSESMNSSRLSVTQGVRVQCDASRRRSLRAAFGRLDSLVGLDLRHRVDGRAPRRTAGPQHGAQRVAFSVGDDATEQRPFRRSVGVKPREQVLQQPKGFGFRHVSGAPPASATGPRRPALGSTAAFSTTRGTPSSLTRTTTGLRRRTRRLRTPSVSS